MKAAVMYEPFGDLSVEEVEISKPGPREVLVRLKAVGVCHSDVHYWTGAFPHKAPVILGHEGAGIVEQVGGMVSHVKPGDHVISIISPFCGTCEYCLSGHMSVCHTLNADTFQRGKDEPPRLALNDKPLQQYLQLSAFAEQVLVHENTLCKIDPEMPLDRACLIGCGVITGVGSVFHAAKVDPGSTVAVIGCGGVGLSTINGAAIAGAARIIAIDLSDEKLDMAKKFGATDTINAGDGNPVRKVRALTGGGVHYAFEAIGLKQTIEQAIGMLRPRGLATLIGMMAPKETFEIPGLAMTFQEKRVQGAIMGSNRFRVDFPRLIELYQQGRLNLDDLVSDRIGLDGVTEALRNLHENKASIARQVVVFD